MSAPTSSRICTRSAIPAAMADRAAAFAPASDPSQWFDATIASHLMWTMVSITPLRLVYAAGLFRLLIAVRPGAR